MFTMSTSVNIRIYDPYRENELYRYEGSKPSGIIVFEPRDGISRLMHVSDGCFVGEPGTIVVSVSGATDAALIDVENCNPRASYGVLFGRDSTHNKQGRVLPATRDQTLKAGDLMAACKALDLVADKYRLGQSPFEDLKTLVIKTASTNLFNGITVKIWDWKRNGWMNNRRQPVACQDLWLRLDDAVQALESHEVRVCFWLVDPDQNAVAEALADIPLAIKSVQVDEGDEDLEDCECCFRLLCAQLIMNRLKARINEVVVSSQVK